MRRARTPVAELLDPAPHPETRRRVFEPHHHHLAFEQRGALCRPEPRLRHPDRAMQALARCERRLRNPVHPLARQVDRFSLTGNRVSRTAQAHLAAKSDPLPAAALTRIFSHLSSRPWVSGRMNEDPPSAAGGIRAAQNAGFGPARFHSFRPRHTPRSAARP